jgi:hypothetical protein
MKTRASVKTGILVMTLAAAALGGCSVAARADVITLDVSGSMSPVASAGATCAPSGCTLGGDIVINNSTNAIVSADVTVAGESPSVGPFINSGSPGPVFGTDLTGVEVDAAPSSPLSVNALILIFSTPTAGSLIGYTGGALSTLTQIGTLTFQPGDGTLFTQLWTLTSGALAPPTPVPEPSSLRILLMALAGFCMLGGRQLLSGGSKRRSKLRPAAISAMLVGCGLFGAPAQAAYIVTLMQEGPDVVATGSGTINLTGLRSAGVPFGGGAVGAPNEGAVVTGPTVAQFDGYAGFTGPPSFGSGRGTFASSGSGDPVGINGEFGFLYVPVGYVSGHSLVSSADTWDNATFTSLGVTPGTYVWTWGSGASADSFTLDIVTAAVPEPSSLALLALPLGIVALAATARRKSNLTRGAVT